MAKYRVGDKVRIVSERPNDFGFVDLMEEYLGKTLTVSKVKERPYTDTDYYMEEATIKGGLFDGVHWTFGESWISGLAEPDREPYTVELRFDGMITTATLKRGGRDVKTAEARCNPKDTYSRAEGAKVAVERLFEKKRKEDKPKESKPKVGDKFVIVGDTVYHAFPIGEIVSLVCFGEDCNRYMDGYGLRQWVHDFGVKPYKETSE